MFFFKTMGAVCLAFLFSMGESQSLSAHENADALWDPAQPMQTLHGKNLPGMILLIEDGSLSIRIHHHISLWVGTGKKVCGKNRHLSWWLSISWSMIARTFPWWKYSGDPSISCMSGEFLTTNLRLAHGAGSLTGCFPQAVSSVPLFRRHKKFGVGQNGKETDWTLLKLNFMLQTLRKHWVFSQCLTCFFFFVERSPGCHGGAVSKRWTGWTSPWRVPLAAFPSEKSAFRSIPGCQVQPTVGEGPGNDPKISPEKWRFRFSRVAETDRGPGLVEESSIWGFFSLKFKILCPNVGHPILYPIFSLGGPWTDWLYPQKWDHFHHGSRPFRQHSGCNQRQRRMLDLDLAGAPGLGVFSVAQLQKCWKYHVDSKRHRESLGSCSWCWSSQLQFLTWNLSLGAQGLSRSKGAHGWGFRDNFLTSLVQVQSEGCHWRQDLRDFQSSCCALALNFGSFWDVK